MEAADRGTNQYSNETVMAANGTSATTAASTATGSGSNINRGSKSAILVRRNQKANPALKLLQNVAWQYEDILADYEVGRTTGVLFLRCVRAMFSDSTIR